MDATVTATKTQFFDSIKRYLTQDDFTCVQEALELARRAHGEQRRKSGELFFTHPLTVAYYLADYHLDVPTLTAALLHDVAEDTLITIAEIEALFGKEVGRLVDGVTKLKTVTEGVAQGSQLTPQELQDATLHKLLDAMTNDIRTVIIKLFDRLHNMRTIQAVPAHKQISTAKETLTVYAPLANRLGIWTVKNELESRSLELIHPAAYQTIKEQLEIIRADQKPFYETVRQEINDLLAQADIKAHVSLEPQNIYTVYQDLTTKGAAYDHIDNTLRLEILLNDLIDCYTALGHLHQVWKPVPGRFDDYIAVPRDNLYRSLHTTVIHPTNGSHIKLRLRTKVMDKVSEVGILARWLYADRPMWSQEIDKPIQIFLENIHENIHIEPQNPGAGVAGVVEDVFRRQIRVYTPRGQTVDLAKGATAVDFAYAIHTGLGEQCHTAQVNGEFYPLNRPLQDGDQVNINKRPWAQPRRAWLDEDLGYLATNYARSHVRRWFRRLPDDVAIAQGKKLLQTELESLNLSTYPHQKIATSFDYSTTQLYYCLGRAEILPTVVATRVLEDSWGQEPTRHLDNVVYAPNGEKFVIMNADGRRLRLCGTCNPRPGDAITGFLRQDNGVTVHQDSCHLVRPEHMTGRLLRLDWGKAQRQAHVITLQVDVYDRPGLLYEITDLVGNEKINIPYIHTPSHNVSGQTRIILSLEIVHPRQLIRILHQIQALANVIHSHVLPGGPPSTKDEYLPPTMYRPE